MVMVLRTEPPRLIAVLGPTNTGKTHLAVERMLGHRSGMIGLPLRLLAREIYDRIVAMRGRGCVALITGEERIVPQTARYYVCTTESMPVGMSVAFLAIDEIQLAADPERGHVFTDRLLRARGTEETMVMGAASIRPLIRKLVPGAEFVVRPRFSKLTYAGAKKTTRLPPRSAVVAFSAADVYELAETMRRQRGGCAVVLGALSPRARNAQVAMYQAGEVDYIVATDAIGMGLNMDVRHVAFAATRKFDGARPRRLSAAELAQIAGRAGRHMNDGTFGVTGRVDGMDEADVHAIENHTFPDLKTLMWRNSDLDTRSVKALLRSLEARPERAGLVRARRADDHMALAALAHDPDIAGLAKGRDAVRLMWEVCQIPDFRKVMADHHVKLLAHIYRSLMGSGHRLPDDWVARSIERINRTDGDIDTLMSRIAHIRTWTYIAHRSDWVGDHGELQERTRAIEDRLSDALHDRLTQRFVDRRAATIARRLNGDGSLAAHVAADGAVAVEGEEVGHLEGFRFAADKAASQGDGRTLWTAARRALRPEIARRVAACEGDDDAVFDADERLYVLWRGARVARLGPGPDALRPRIDVLRSEFLDDALRARVAARLGEWVAGRLEQACRPLLTARDADLKGPARGLVFQIVENLGVVATADVATLIRDLSADDRKALARLGVRMGLNGVYLKPLMSSRHLNLRALMWAAHAGAETVPGVPQKGEVAIDAQALLGDGFYRAIGYIRLGPRAIRVDMVERLAAETRKATRKGRVPVTPALLSMSGSTSDQFRAVMAALGFRVAGADGALTMAPAPSARCSRAPRPDRHDASSPFAILRDLEMAR
jgi:ATP-dependent RNA helicase SUPV3L1/SUV3